MCENKRLELKAWLVISVGKYKEDILQQTQIIAMVEAIAYAGIWLRNVGQQLKTDIEPDIHYFTMSMLEGPDDGVQNKFKLSRRQGKQRCRIISQEPCNTKKDLPGKQWLLTARIKLKKPIRCSGNSSKSLLIMPKVHSKIESSISGILSVRLP